MRVVDLFAGCGGISLGFQQSGFDIVAAFEYWTPAVETYRNNFNHIVHQIDLSDAQGSIEIIRQYDPEMIIGGPPCQEYSQCGKRVEGEKAALTQSYCEIVKGIRPKIFVMENVRRASKSKTYQSVKSQLEDAGYTIEDMILDAIRFNVPQARERLFCIGYLPGLLKDVQATVLERMTANRMSVRDHLPDIGIDHYYRHPRNYSRRAIFSVDEPSPTIRGVNRPVAKGYTANHNDAAPVTDSLRSLTTMERASIQTFPKDFQFNGSKTQIEQMIGNAVPVNLAKEIGIAILQNMEEQKMKCDRCGTEMERGLAIPSALRESRGISMLDEYSTWPFNIEEVHKCHECGRSIADDETKLLERQGKE